MTHYVLHNTRNHLKCLGTITHVYNESLIVKQSLRNLQQPIKGSERTFMCNKILRHNTFATVKTFLCTMNINIKCIFCKCTKITFENI